MKYRGLERVSLRVSFTVTMFNVLRMSHLTPQANSKGAMGIRRCIQTAKV